MNGLKKRVERLERTRIYQLGSDGFEETINGMSEEGRTIDWGNGILTKVIINNGELALTTV